MAASCRKNTPRFVCGEHSLFTKHIAVFRELLPGDLRNHLFDHQLDVFSPSCPELSRNVMGAKKRRHVPQRRLFVQTFDSLQDLDFVFQGEAVTRLSLNRGCAAAQKPLRIALTRMN
jgi:hypothetical protein